MYKCICGKEFEKHQSYVAHCGWCKSKRSQEYIDNKISCMTDNRNKAIIRNTRRRRSIETLIKILNNRVWELEGNHYCEYCHKEMKKKYSSGRFCSSSCARSYSSNHPNNINNMEARMKAFRNHDDNKGELLFERLLTDHHIDFKREVVFSKASLGFRHESGYYRVDFLIADSIILEIDGSSHDNEFSQEHDKIRDERFLNSGYQVVRAKYYSDNYPGMEYYLSIVDELKELIKVKLN